MIKYILSPRDVAWEQTLQETNGYKHFSISTGQMVDFLGALKEKHKENQTYSAGDSRGESYLIGGVTIRTVFTPNESSGDFEQDIEQGNRVLLAEAEDANESRLHDLFSENGLECLFTKGGIR